LLVGLARRREGAGPAAALLEELGLYGSAEAVLREAAGPGGSLELAGFLARRGRSQEAIDLCRKLWPGCPAADVARVTLGSLDADPALDLATVERVAVLIGEAAAGADRPAPIWTCLAGVREIQGRYREAESLYRRARAADGTDPVALNNLAVLVVLRGGDRREALDLVKRAIDRAGPHPALLDTRAIVRLSSGDTLGAIEDLTEAVAESPTGPTYFHLAQAQLRGGRHDEALRSYRRMLDLLARDPPGRRQVDAEEALRPGALASLRRLDVPAARPSRLPAGPPKPGAGPGS
jgi:tetratricopeptide (TPR) repeat protein